jgi:alpha-aminoadipic semialdehyde synthase
VKPDDLKNLKHIVGVDNKKIIISQFTSEHLVKHKDGRPFNKADYYANPNNYVTKFAEEYLEHVHWFINGVYWEAKYPRIISINEIKEAVASGKSKLLGVCDISADYMGSVEFTSKFTSIEQPFLLYDPLTEEFKESMNDANENSILFHSVDHLPAEMPKEASNHFGDKLNPFVKAVVNSDFSKPFS